YYDYFFGLPHRDWHKDFSARNYSAYFLCSERVRANVLLGTCEDVESAYDPWGGWTWGFGTHGAPSDFKPTKRDASHLMRDAREALARHSATMRQANLPVNVARLEKLLTDLAQRGVSVMFVTLPDTRYYQRGMDPNAYRRMQEALARLSSTHGAK